MTLEDFLALPETKPYCEFVRGEVKPKAMPNDFHSALVTELVFRLRTFLAANPVARVDTELRHISNEERRIYLPDVSVTRLERWPATRENPVPVPPDLVVEVISPDDRAGDVLEKADFYLHIGVRLIWLVDPEGRSVTVYRQADAPQLLRPPATLDATPVFEGFALSLDGLFSVIPVESEGA
jgi:Uma2 family endonuclease